MKNLIPCKSCEHPVSTGAKACPRCGHDLEKDRQGKNDFVQKIVMVGVAAIFLILLKTGVVDTILKQITLFK